jgi:hypothetical protein
MFGRSLPVPDSKILQNHGIPPFGYPCFHHTKPMETDPGSFPRKTGSLFPDQEPPLFFGHIVIPGHSRVPHDQLIVPFFTIKGTRLNCTVFSRLKRSVSKNTCLKRKSRSGLALFPLECYSLGSGPKTLRRRMKHRRGHVRPPPPFIKGVLPKGWSSSTLPGVRVRVIIRPPPFELAYGEVMDPKPSPGPLVPGAEPDLPGDPW